MMAEREVCEVISIVAGVEEKSGVDISSNQDLTTPDYNGISLHDQSNDPENSYVFVTGADGLGDGPVDNKDAVSIGASFQLESRTPVESLGVELDAVDEDNNKSLKEGENEAVMGSDGCPPVGNGITVEKELSPVDGEGLKETLEETNLDVENGKLDVLNAEVNKSLMEGASGNVERTHQNQSIVNGIKLEQESFLEDADGTQDTMKEHIRKPKCWAETEISKVEDPTGKLESSEVAEIEKINDQHEKIDIAAEDEQKKAEDQTITEFSPGLEEDKESGIPNLGLVSEPGEGEKLNNIAPLNESVKAQDAGEDEINLVATEAPQLLVEDAPESKLQEVNEENEIKLIREIVETVEPEVQLKTSLNLDLEFRPIKNEKATVEDVKAALSTEENQQGDSVPNNNVQCDPDKEKSPASNTDCNIETVCDQVLEGKSKDFSVSHVEDLSHHPEVPDEHAYCDEVCPEIMNSETEAPVCSQSLSDSGAKAYEPLTEIKDCGAETVVVSSSSIDSLISEIVEKGPFGHDNSDRPTENSVSSGSYASGEMIVCIKREQNFLGDYASIGTEVSGDSVEGDCPHASTDVKLEPEFHKDIDTIGVVTVSSSTDVLDSSATEKEGVANNILESADVKVIGNQLDRSIESITETSLLPRDDDFGNSQKNHMLKTSSEIREDMSTDSVTKPFNFLIRIPRFNDENLREQIRDAKLEVDEKTKLRDAIQAQIQEKRASNQIHGVDYEYAKGEDRSVRRLVKLKRMEIESLQSVINKAKNAISIEDMDSRINNMEYMIQHETLPLREEKQLIREIKQLKQLREQLSSNMGSQNEIQQALEQRDEAEEQLKILKKELGSLKDRVSKAQTATVEAESRYDDENKKVKGLQDQFRAADDLRQAAYAKWQSLRKQLSQMNKYFFKYKDDEAAANNYAFNRNREELYCLCADQVENFMELWNKNSEFRGEYVRFNTRSTVRRFGTLDGRSLGHDEKPYILPNSVTNEISGKMASIQETVHSVTQNPTLENSTSGVVSVKKVAEHKKQTVTRKDPSKPMMGDSLVNASSWDVSDEVQEEDSVKTMEEIETIRKEEEIRRKEEEAKKKEELRLEQLAKANAAREKKKRHDEKVQMREELRARKEAELKEKEREKKMRKKERKMAATMNDNNENSESAVEIVKEDIQVNDDSASATSKKPKKPSMLGRQNKTKSIPPPLRNRNKKKWQQWMWVGLACAAIILVFWVGNMGLFTNVNLKHRGPAL